MRAQIPIPDDLRGFRYDERDARLVSRGLADLAVLAYFRSAPKTSFHNPFITPVVAPKAVTPAKRR